MALDLILLVVGLLFLFKGGDWLVAGASGLARRFGVADIVIGLTIVAFGTSAPELVVSLTASLKGSAALSVANVVGSNICNILLIVGIAAVICPLFVHHGTVWKEIPFVLLASAVLAVQANDSLISGAPANSIDRGDGLILLAFFGIFLYYIGQLIAEGLPEAKTGAPDAPDTIGLGKALALIVIGLVVLLAGGNWVVNGAIELARLLGISENVIGLTIVAIGTSLPELATSSVAAYRKNTDIAVGNIVGSNIFNILFILGISSLARPLEVASGSNRDILVMLGAAVMLFLAMMVGKPRNEIQRAEGAAFLVLYVGYIGWLLVRG